MSKEFVIKNEPVVARKKIDYAAELNAEQLTAVIGAEGPCLVLAGAGSGKTRTITYRVAYLLEHGVDPRNILLLTFTNKAAREMLGRVELLLGAAPKGLWGGTFHAVCHRILRSLATQAGYQENFSILDQEDSRSLIKAVVREMEIDIKARRFPSPNVIQSIISYSRNSCLSLEETIDLKHPRFMPLTDQLKEIASRYAEKKRNANAMDFDDLLLVTLELMRAKPEIHRRLADQFHYILVDEYQDTNPIQARLVEMLAVKHKNLLVVGDDAQSIYSFRAAEVRNILDFPNTFPGAKIFKLETNYRSTPEILNLANDIIEKNRKQFRKVLRPTLDSYVKPQLAPARGAREEAVFIAEMLLQLRDEGLKLQDMAVLFRAAHHSQSLEFELAKRDIPYEYRGGMKFFERSHIKDALAFLRVRDNPADQLSWIRVLAFQTGIGSVTATRIAQAVGQSSNLEEALASFGGDTLSERTRLGWQRLQNLLGKLVKEEKPAELIQRVSESREYQEYLEHEYPNWQERLDDLEQLRVFAGPYESLTEFLGEVSLFDDYGAARQRGAPSDDERVILSTIHQAKGLEWNTVFIMNLTADDFPNRRAILEDGGIEEERRLFYVASTRAARQLYLTYPATSGYDSLAIQQPSPFLEELDTSLLEEVSAKEEDEVIELDDFGEEKPRKHSYLSDIWDL